MLRLEELERSLARWLVALGTVGATTLLNFWMQHATDGRAPFLPYFPALMAIGYYCGAAPSIVAVALATLAVTTFWIEPVGRPLTVLHAADLAMLGLFVAAASAAVGVALLARRAVDAREDALLGIRDAQRRLDVALRGSSIVAWACDAERRYTWVYNPLPQLAGEVFVGRRIGEVVARERYPDYLDAVERVFATGVAERLPVSLEFDGETHHYVAHIEPVKDADGRVTGLVGASMDVTDLRRTEAALARTEELYLSLAEAAPDLMWTAAADGTALHVNRRWVEYTGLTRERLNQVGWGAVAHPDDRARVAAIREQAARRGEAFETEGRYRGKDGEYRWFWGRVVPVKDAQGRVQQWVGTFTDIQERKRMEAQLALESRRKDEFFATLAHELRNPMAPIRYAVALLRPGANAEVMERARRVIERQSTRMARLLDDLLDMSRITRDAIELRLAPVDLRDVLHDAIEAAQPALEAREHRLVVSLPSQRVIVQGDAARLVQVAGNLLDNAAKYTAHGGRIELALEARGADAVVSVSDSGIGLAAEEVPRVFELFSQARASTSGPQQGLGIGLFIVDKLVQRHGGSIAASSAGPGRGATFTVRLPRADAPPAGAAPDDAGANVVALFQRQPPVLVVDDNVDAAEVLAAVLRLEDVPVTIAHNGAAALEAFERTRPELVLLDLGLPDIDGTEVARRMRARPGGERVRIIAVTGWGQARDRERTQAAGFDDHVVKPVDPETLLALLPRELPPADASRSV
jgi:two-component system CheB/CheR fusion protein